MADAISLEETNALRAKLGLPPLAGDTEETVDPDRVAYENYQRMKQDQEKEAKAKEIKDRIEKSKNRKKNLEKLQGKGLGEETEEEDSTLNWIRRSRQREKELAEKRARELAEMDESFENGANAYTSTDLSGLRVAHDLSQFDEGGEMVLTLKDKNIMDEGEGDDDMDELTNIQVEEKERLRKKLEEKKKKPGYNPYDDEEFLLGGAKQSILPQYEEDDDKKNQGFTIGQRGTINVKKDAPEESISEKLKAQTLAYEKMQEIKDYYTQEEVSLSFKKPKKKKKVRRKAAVDPEDDLTSAPPATDESAPSTQNASQRRSPMDDEEANFVDDDELQAALARSRRAANKQKQKQLKKMTPEEIAQSIAEAREQEREDAQDDEGGLVLSEMSEFVNSLGVVPAFAREPRENQRRSSETPGIESPETASSSHKPVTAMEEEEEEESPETLKEQPSAEQETKLSTETADEAGSGDQATIKNEQEPATVMEEPLVSGGLAATLSLLTQKGFLAKPTQEQIEKDKRTAAQIRWQNEERKREAQRAREREKERLRHKGRDSDRGRESDRNREKEREREREREREMEERERLREVEERMKNYKPDVNLVYVDEQGRQMNTKEAFRFMSHKFHGKTSGKLKTEKRMQKIEEELKLNMMSSTDTPLNLAGALLERQQRTGSAHVVLSVGNRGVVPPEVPLAVNGESSKKRKASTSGEDSDKKKSKK
ncbi:SART-1 protein [Radiomyces spectabilis]|uniref:SART-1 protein n=1 Tax=Radiomyces spectabilis TaxID=64574 RepID=UPI00221F63D9|nr:SART-1 protein [Radiomyces spectabilis]KAI8377715.1 SART-1 protein [Radiomyces spectabilis]